MKGTVGMARPERFELPTYSSGGCRSIQLSYGRALKRNVLASGYQRLAAHLLHRWELCLQVEQAEDTKYAAARIYEASGKFYLQYRVAVKQVSKLLCDKTPAFYSKSCKAVRLKADEVILAVNKEAVSQPKPMADMKCRTWSSHPAPIK